MNVATQIVLNENLKALKSQSYAGQLEPVICQAQENALDCGEFLLTLTDHEIQMRGENRIKRRLREAKFQLLKTL